MKKILFCIDSLKPGGAEIIMCNTVNELVKDSNLDITVQLLQKEQKLNLDEKVKVNTFMNNNIFYRRIIKWMPASILHKLIIKEKYDYEIAYQDVIIKRQKHMHGYIQIWKSTDGHKEVIEV